MLCLTMNTNNVPSSTSRNDAEDHNAATAAATTVDDNSTSFAWTRMFPSNVRHLPSTTTSRRLDGGGSIDPLLLTTTLPRESLPASVIQHQQQQLRLQQQRVASLQVLPRQRRHHGSGDDSRSFSHDIPFQYEDQFTKMEDTNIYPRISTTTTASSTFAATSGQGEFQRTFAANGNDSCLVGIISSLSSLSSSSSSSSSSSKLHPSTINDLSHDLKCDQKVLRSSPIQRHVCVRMMHGIFRNKSTTI